MSIAEKLTTIAENEPKVYEKGKTDFGYKKSVSGSYLYIDDINQNEKTVPTVVSSKNLFNINGSLSDKVGWVVGETILLEDGKIKATADYQNGMGKGQFIKALPNTTYTLRFKVCEMEVSGNSQIAAYSIDSNNKQTLIAMPNRVFTQVGTYTRTFTTLDNTEQIWLAFCGVSILGEMTNGKYYTIYDEVQLERGNVATDYTPYVDVANTKLTVCGKNLFDSNKLLQCQGWKEEDGVYNGNPVYLHSKWGSKSVIDAFEPDTRYTISFDGYNEQNIDAWTPGLMVVFLYNDGATEMYSVKGNSWGRYTATSKAGKTLAKILLSYGVSCICYIKNFYVTKASSHGEYEAYTGAEYIPNTDGVLSVTPYYPITNMFTDNTGVTINTEYYADSEKIIGELTDTIISLGGTLDV